MKLHVELSDSWDEEEKRGRSKQSFTATSCWTDDPAFNS
jgi:hypothetical protein